jgi:hypothetical protein
MTTDIDNTAGRQEQLRRACAELERRLRAGGPGGAEDLLADYPAVAACTEAALELVYTEYVVREELGQRPDSADWLRRFPLWRDDLRQLFQVDRAAGGSGRSDTGAAAVTPLAPGRAGGPGAGPAPRRFGAYEILDEVGRGGMGVVYRARQQGLDRTVAVKVLLAGPHAGAEALARFRDEARAIARLRHPNIVQIHEVGEQDGCPYFALEYVEGGSLERRLNGAPWPAAPAARLAETLARAVHEAHRLGVVHRDLKPANVLLTADGTPKVTDFGLAKFVAGPGQEPAEVGRTQTTAVVGTPSYMAPEQATGKRHVGPGADVYALGAVLYELLTGRPPFRGETALDTLRQVAADEPVPPRRLNPRVPRDLATVCLRCLRREPAGRYPSALALAEDLRRFLDGRPVAARPVGPAARLGRWCRRNPALAGAGGLAATALLVLAIAAPLVAVQQASLRHDADRHAQAADEAGAWRRGRSGLPAVTCTRPTSTWRTAPGRRRRSRACASCSTSCGRAPARRTCAAWNGTSCGSSPTGSGWSCAGTRGVSWRPPSRPAASCWPRAAGTAACACGTRLRGPCTAS